METTWSKEWYIQSELRQTENQYTKIREPNLDELSNIVGLGARLHLKMAKKEDGITRLFKMTISSNDLRQEWYQIKIVDDALYSALHCLKYPAILSHQAILNATLMWPDIISMTEPRMFNPTSTTRIEWWYVEGVWLPGFEKTEKTESSFMEYARTHISLWSAISMVAIANNWITEIAADRIKSALELA